MIPIEILNAMIEAGWGDVPRDHIPHDWESRPGPDHGSQRRSVRAINLDAVPVRRRVRRSRESRLVQDAEWMRKRQLG